MYMNILIGLSNTYIFVFFFYVYIGRYPSDIDENRIAPRADHKDNSGPGQGKLMHPL